MTDHGAFVLFNVYIPALSCEDKAEVRFSRSAGALPAVRRSCANPAQSNDSCVYLARSMCSTARGIWLRVRRKLHIGMGELSSGRSWSMPYRSALRTRCRVLRCLERTHAASCARRGGTWRSWATSTLRQRPLTTATLRQSSPNAATAAGSPHCYRSRTRGARHAQQPPQHPRSWRPSACKHPRSCMRRIATLRRAPRNAASASTWMPVPATALSHMPGDSPADTPGGHRAIDSSEAADAASLPCGGFADTFRWFHAGRAAAYTCWSTATGARNNNWGTRIDLVLVADPASPPPPLANAAATPPPPMGSQQRALRPLTRARARARRTVPRRESCFRHRMAVARRGSGGRHQARAPGIRSCALMAAS